MARLFRIRVNFARECRKKRGFLEKIETQYLQNFVHAPIELVFFFDDGHQDVDADRNPYLRLDGVVGGSVKRFDS